MSSGAGRIFFAHRKAGDYRNFQESRLHFETGTYTVARRRPRSLPPAGTNTTPDRDPALFIRPSEVQASVVFHRRDRRSAPPLIVAGSAPDLFARGIPLFLPLTKVKAAGGTGASTIGGIGGGGACHPLCALADDAPRQSARAAFTTASRPCRCRPHVWIFSAWRRARGKKAGIASGPVVGMDCFSNKATSIQHREGMLFLKTAPSNSMDFSWFFLDVVSVFQKTFFHHLLLAIARARASTYPDVAREGHARSFSSSWTCSDPPMPCCSWIRWIGRIRSAVSIEKQNRMARAAPVLSRYGGVGYRKAKFPQWAFGTHCRTGSRAREAGSTPTHGRSSTLVLRSVIIRLKFRHPMRSISKSLARSCFHQWDGLFLFLVDRMLPGLEGVQILQFKTYNNIFFSPANRFSNDTTFWMASSMSCRVAARDYVTTTTWWPGSGFTLVV